MTFTELDARRIGRVRRFFARHPSASDVLVCVVSLGCTLPWLMDVADEIAAGTDLNRARVVLAVGMVLTATAALAVRRRWPLLVTATIVLCAVGLNLTAGSASPVVPAFALALYAVAAERSPLAGWLSLLAGTVVATAVVLLWGGGSGSTAHIVNVGVDGSEPEMTSGISDLLDVVVLGLIAITIGTSVHGRRQHVRTLVDRHAQLVEAGEQQARLAAATEQTRIAREMHDVVAHGLTVMVALSDGARAAVHRSPDDAVHALDLLSETGRSALTDMRRMLGVLRGGDAPLEPQPGAQDLDALVQSYRNAGMTVRLTTAGMALPTDAALALTVYRVVQESLTNALRHAGAQARVEVLVQHEGRRIGIDVVDDGGGLTGPVVERRADPGPLTPITARTGRGLVGMRERAAAYGGSVEAGPVVSAAHGGWRVHVELRTDDVPTSVPAARGAGSGTGSAPVVTPAAATHPAPTPVPLPITLPGPVPVEQPYRGRARLDPPTDEERP
ncbi:MAG TPA: histidine kinase [Cellulomonas sp.]